MGSVSLQDGRLECQVDDDDGHERDMTCAEYQPRACQCLGDFVNALAEMKSLSR